jgi:hypothetical protein
MTTTSTETSPVTFLPSYEVLVTLTPDRQETVEDKRMLASLLSDQLDQSEVEIIAGKPNENIEFWKVEISMDGKSMKSTFSRPKSVIPPTEEEALLTVSEQASLAELYPTVTDFQKIFGEFFLNNKIIQKMHQEIINTSTQFRAVLGNDLYKFYVTCVYVDPIDLNTLPN